MTTARPDRRKAVPGALWFEPGADLRRVAGVICDKAWHGKAVRAYYWPDGMVVIVTVDSRGDQLLMRHAIHALVGTFKRAGSMPQQFDVLDQLQWAAAHAPSPRDEDEGARRWAVGRHPGTSSVRSGSEPVGGSLCGDPHAGSTAAISL